MEVVEVERILLILKGLGFSQTSEETIKMILGTQSFDLAEHDNQIREEVIEEYKNALLKLIKDEQDTRYGYLDEKDIREVAKQVKNHK